MDTPGDPFEQEADRVADTIAGPGSALNDSPPALLADRPPLAESPLAGLSGAGRSLPPELRRNMETRFGYDFGSIRVHTDQSAATAASRLGAQAFTRGRDLVFGAGQFRPHTHSGRWLIAHELTHAAQQARTFTAPQLQRRTATPIRNDRQNIFTYTLEVFTVSEETLQEAQGVRDTLNAFRGTVADPTTGDDYTVRFVVRVYPPPAVDVLEKHFGKRLRYRLGKQRVKKRAYQRAAQNYWVEVLKRSGNQQNLYLGENSPTREVDEFIRADARQQENQAEQALMAEYRRRVRQARTQNPQKTQADPNWVDPQVRAWYDKEKAKLDKVEHSETTDDRLDNPGAVVGSRGTTFGGAIIQMRPTIGEPGGEAYMHNVRLHEFMHLLGLDVDYEDLKDSVMSYPRLKKTKRSGKKLAPTQSDIEQLVYEKNPPPP